MKTAASLSWKVPGALPVLAMIAVLFCFPCLTKAKTLDTLVVRGLRINSQDKVRSAIPLRPGADFTASDVQESIKKLSELQLFRAIDVFVGAESDSGASLIIKVEEFPFCESIEYVGCKKFKAKDFEEKMPIKARQIVSDNDVFRGQQCIKEMYAKKGYLLADVAVERVPSKVPGNVVLKFVITEGARVKIRNITFKGNKGVKESKLKGKFKTKESRWWRSGDFDEELYRSHLDSLVMYYNDLGYLDASIVHDSVWFSESKKDLSIAITVDEGKKYYAGRFDFTGNSVIPADSLAAKVMLKYGKPFNKTNFDMTKYFVESVYREEGYLWVGVDEKRHYRGDTIDVTLTISEGKPAIVRKVDVRGNTKTREKVVRREIDLLPGQRYRQSLMASSRQRIFSLNYFSDVKPDLTPNADGTIDMVFEVVEKENIGQFQIGAAYSQVDGFVGTLSLGIPNFRGMGQEMKVDLQYGAYHRAIDLSFKEPWAFNSPTSLSGEVFGSWSVPFYYSSSRQDTLESDGFEIGIGRSKLSWPDNHFSVNLSYRFSYERSTYLLATMPGVVEVLRRGILSRVSLGIVRYDLDMPQFPSSGSRFSITPQIAGVGGDFSYLKGTALYEHYFPLPLRLSLGSRIRGGIIRPLKPPIKISRYDLFKIGGVYGDADLRGYEDYRFGGYYNSPDQGLCMFASTLELRYPLLEQQLYLGVFGDAGNTWTDIGKVDLGDLYKGIGFGLRLNIPMMGLMGFDFAWGLDDPFHRAFDRQANGFKLHFLMNRGF